MRLLLPLFIVLSACSGCDQSTDSAEPATTAEPDPDTAGQIEYVARWNHEGITPLATGWRVTNDQRYVIDVHRGYMVTYGASLVPCPEPTDDGLGGLIRTVLGIGTAYAGHSSEADPSAINDSRVESVSDPVSWTIGQIAVPAARYCEAHYLVARADEETRDMPDSIDLARKSLYLTGTYRAPDETEVKSFEVETSLANGVIHPLVHAGETTGIDLGQADVQIVIERPLAGLFAGVAFDTMSTSAVERQILTALMTHTSVTTYVTP